MIWLAPPTANPLTGGYLYNRHIARRLETRLGLRYRWVAAADLQAAVAFHTFRQTDPVVILDSLYQRDGPMQTAGDGAWPLRWVLLCHVVPWAMWPTTAGWWKPTRKQQFARYVNIGKSSTG